MSPESDSFTTDDSADQMNDPFQLSADQDPEILEILSPKVRKRVEFLMELQKVYNKVQAKFFEERSQLEARYLKLYEPIYQKRYEIVNGITEVEPTDETDEATENKGIPNFWLNAMKSNETLAEEITEPDEGALEYLQDIEWCRIDNSRSFKLQFFFYSNPYFKNSVLEKTYNMEDEDEPLLVNAEGTEIEWYPGKCLTHKVLERMPTKRSNNDEPLTNREKCKSFFDFFNPPQIHEKEENDNDDIDIHNHHVPVEGIHKDLDSGCIIRDQIIPRAVTWFTGEATR